MYVFLAMHSTSIRRLISQCVFRRGTNPNENAADDQHVQKSFLARSCLDPQMYTNFLQYFDWDTHKHWVGHRKQTHIRSWCQQCSSRLPSKYQRAKTAGRKKFFPRMGKNHRSGRKEFRPQRLTHQHCMGSLATV